MNMDHVHTDSVDDADEEFVSEWLDKRGMRAVVKDANTVTLSTSAVVYFPGGRDPIVLSDGDSPETIADSFGTPVERAVAVARLTAIARTIERYAPSEAMKSMEAGR